MRPGRLVQSAYPRLLADDADVPAPIEPSHEFTGISTITACSESASPAAKRLADTPGIGVIAFEDLTRIRRLARKGTKTSRRRRSMLNQWPFSQLQEFTAYKAAANGIRS